MDDPELGAVPLSQALRGLRRLNALSLADAHLWRALSTQARRANRTIRVLDVACASGDWVLRAAAHARGQRLPAVFAGCDANPLSIELAERRAASLGLACSFFAHDVLRDGPLGEYDVVMSSLFLHHLSDDDARLALAQMAAASHRAVIVNDLLRTRLNLWMVVAASRMLTRSPIVHADAALSVRAAFTRYELLALAQRAGLHGATIGAGGIGRATLVWSRHS